MKRPKYTIINEGAGFSLYRKLFPGEEIWYVNELYRLRTLKKNDKDIWLHLKSDRDKAVLESIKDRLFEGAVYQI